MFLPNHVGLYMISVQETALDAIYEWNFESYEFMKIFGSLKTWDILYEFPFICKGQTCRVRIPTDKVKLSLIKSS